MFVITDMVLCFCGCCFIPHLFVSGGNEKGIFKS
uniref:Uncharacterized protein n=1 Tax=Arundo donax TaxID=35708 RepID=A0A0A9GV07_ARUDO